MPHDSASPGAGANCVCVEGGGSPIKICAQCAAVSLHNTPPNTTSPHNISPETTTPHKMAYYTAKPHNIASQFKAQKTIDSHTIAPNHQHNTHHNPIHHRPTDHNPTHHNPIHVSPAGHSPSYYSFEEGHGGCRRGCEVTGSDEQHTKNSQKRATTHKKRAYPPKQ